MTSGRVQNHSTGLTHSFFQLLRPLAADSLLCSFQGLALCYSMLFCSRSHIHPSRGKPHPITGQCRGGGIKSRFPVFNFSQFSRIFQHQSSPMGPAEAFLETVSESFPIFFRSPRGYSPINLLQSNISLKVYLPRTQPIKVILYHHCFSSMFSNIHVKTFIGFGFYQN